MAPPGKLDGVCSTPRILTSEYLKAEQEVKNLLSDQAMGWDSSKKSKYEVVTQVMSELRYIVIDCVANDAHKKKLEDWKANFGKDPAIKQAFEKFSENLAKIRDPRFAVAGVVRNDMLEILGQPSSSTGASQVCGESVEALQYFREVMEGKVTESYYTGLRNRFKAWKSLPCYRDGSTLAAKNYIESKLREGGSLARNAKVAWEATEREAIAVASVTPPSPSSRPTPPRVTPSPVQPPTQPPTQLVVQNPLRDEAIFGDKKEKWVRVMQRYPEFRNAIRNLQKFIAGDSSIAYLGLKGILENWSRNKVDRFNHEGIREIRIKISSIVEGLTKYSGPFYTRANEALQALKYSGVFLGSTTVTPPSVAPQPVPAPSSIQPPSAPVIRPAPTLVPSPGVSPAPAPVSEADRLLNESKIFGGDKGAFDWLSESTNYPQLSDVISEIRKFLALKNVSENATDPHRLRLRRALKAWGRSSNYRTELSYRASEYFSDTFDRLRKQEGPYKKHADVIYWLMHGAKTLPDWSRQGAKPAVSASAQPAAPSTPRPAHVDSESWKLITRATKPRESAPSTGRFEPAGSVGTQGSGPLQGAGQLPVGYDGPVRNIQIGSGSSSRDGRTYVVGPKYLETVTPLISKPQSAKELSRAIQEVIAKAAIEYSKKYTSHRRGDAFQFKVIVKPTIEFDSKGHVSNVRFIEIQPIKGFPERPLSHEPRVEEFLKDYLTKQWKQRLMSHDGQPIKWNYAFGVGFPI
jgi:hypothetical protein